MRPATCRPPLRIHLRVRHRSTHSKRIGGGRGTWILLPLFLVVPDNGPEETGRVAVLQALAASHQGLEAGDVQKVLGVLGPSCFMADERSSGGPKRLSAHLFLTSEKLQAWPKKFLGEAGPYRNASEPLSVSIRATPPWPSHATRAATVSGGGSRRKLLGFSAAATVNGASAASSFGTSSSQSRSDVAARHGRSGGVRRPAGPTPTLRTPRSSRPSSSR